jgi:hypothetical protein
VTGSARVVVPKEVRAAGNSRNADRVCDARPRREIVLSQGLTHGSAFDPVEILPGLAVGERVINNPQDAPAEGQSVSIATPERPDVGGATQSGCGGSPG